MSEESDLSIEINGDNVELPQSVFDLILNISKERDKYHEMLSYTHELCKLYGKYDRFEEIEKILKLQKEFKQKNG